jgi:hypothetical protein
MKRMIGRIVSSLFVEKSFLSRATYQSCLGGSFFTENVSISLDTTLFLTLSFYLQTDAAPDAESYAFSADINQLLSLSKS